MVQNRLLGGFSGWPKEGVAPAEHLVEDDAESKDVRSVVDRRLFELLGAHVGHAFVAWSTDTLVGSRKPKVGDLYLPLEACENVGRKKTSIDGSPPSGRLTGSGIMHIMYWSTMAYPPRCAL